MFIVSILILLPAWSYITELTGEKTLSSANNTMSNLLWTNFNTFEFSSENWGLQEICYRDFHMVFMFSIVSRLLRMCCESVHCGYCRRKSSPPGCLNMVQHFHLISAAIFSCNVTDEKSGPGPHWKVCKSGCYSPICPETLSLWPSLTSISPSSLPCDTKERTQNMERIVETRQKQIQRAEGDLSLLPRFESVFMYQFLDNI